MNQEIIEWGCAAVYPARLAQPVFEAPAGRKLDKYRIRGGVSDQQRNDLRAILGDEAILHELQLRKLRTSVQAAVAGPPVPVGGENGLVVIGENFECECVGTPLVLVERAAQKIIKAEVAWIKDHG